MKHPVDWLMLAAFVMILVVSFVGAVWSFTHQS